MISSILLLEVKGQNTTLDDPVRGGCAYGQMGGSAVLSLREYPAGGEFEFKL
jgi:hypothetical protein